MAQTAPTKTTESQFAGYLTPHQAQAYFAQARKNSVVQQLARKVPLGINGEAIPVVVSKATAGWVGEGGQKPATSSQIGLKSMKPQKMAAISVVSAEVVRADPGGYMELLKDDISEAFGLTFDAAALHGTNSPFGNGMNLDATTKSVELGTAAKSNGGVYADFVSALRLNTAAAKKVTGWALDGSVEPTILGATDNNGRPLFVDSTSTDTAPSITAGRLLGRQAFITDPGAQLVTPVVTGTPNTGGVVGYGGDWSQVIWGAVGGISYDVSTEATVTINGQLVSLWENNLVAVRAEAEFGFLINDVSAFVKLTDNT